MHRNSSFPYSDGFPYNHSLPLEESQLYPHKIKLENHFVSETNTEYPSLYQHMDSVSQEFKQDCSKTAPLQSSTRIPILQLDHHSAELNSHNTHRPAAPYHNFPSNIQNPQLEESLPLFNLNQQQSHLAASQSLVPLSTSAKTHTDSVAPLISKSTLDCANSSPLLYRQTIRDEVMSSRLLDSTKNDGVIPTLTSSCSSSSKHDILSENTVAHGPTNIATQSCFSYQPNQRAVLPTSRLNLPSLSIFESASAEHKLYGTCTDRMQLTPHPQPSTELMDADTELKAIYDEICQDCMLSLNHTHERYPRGTETPPKKIELYEQQIKQYHSDVFLGDDAFPFQHHNMYTPNVHNYLIASKNQTMKTSENDTEVLPNDPSVTKLQRLREEHYKHNLIVCNTNMPRFPNHDISTLSNSHPVTDDANYQSACIEHGSHNNIQAIGGRIGILEDGPLNLVESQRTKERSHSQEIHCNPDELMYLEPDQQRIKRAKSAYSNDERDYHEVIARVHAATKRFPRRSTQVLKQWLLHNVDNPYPSESDKKELMKRSGLNILQLNNWFINARRRVLVKVSSSSEPNTKPKFKVRDVTSPSSS
eukprot:gene10592-2715_t